MYDTRCCKECNCCKNFEKPIEYELVGNKVMVKNKGFSTSDLESIIIETRRGNYTKDDKIDDDQIVEYLDFIYKTYIIFKASEV